MPIPAIKDPTHPDYPHGQIRGYNHGCKCDHCMNAIRAYNREYHRRTKAVKAGVTPSQQIEADAIAYMPRVPAEPTARRLQALVYVGNTPEHLGQLLTIDPAIIWWLLVAPPTTVRAAFEDRIRRFFRANFFMDVVDTPRAIRRAKALADSFNWPAPHQVVETVISASSSTGGDE